MSLFTNSKIKVEPIAGTARYKLLTSIVWQLVYGKPELGLAIMPTGFTTDWDSTPWFAKPFLRDRLKAKRSFALHDWGFNRGYIWKHDKVTKNQVPVRVGFKQWNVMMREAMKAEGVGTFTRWTMYIGVMSPFGRMVWDGLAGTRLQHFQRAHYWSVHSPCKFSSLLATLDLLDADGVEINETIAAITTQNEYT